MFWLGSKPGCIWCDRARELLVERRVDFEETKCESKDQLRNELAKRGHGDIDPQTYPQILDGSRYIGGYQQLLDFLDEPLLQSNGSRRFTPFPIEHHDMWNMYRKALASFWTVAEINLSDDVTDWRDKLTEDERHFIKHVLAFFAGSDGIVMENVQSNFGVEVQVPEARQFYSYQTFNEAIHCVAPDTLVLTDTGYHRIDSLVDREVRVWNGEQWSSTTVRKTGVDQPLLKIQLSNGMQLDCTTEHKWFVRKGNPAHPECCYIERVMTKDLEVGDIIAKYDVPVVDLKDPDEFLNPYTHGAFCGDGTYCNKYPFISLYADKKDILPYLAVSSVNPYEPHDSIRCYLTGKINKDKFFVPINYSIATKLRWFEGLCDADGCVNQNKTKTATSVQIANVNLKFLQEVQLMLTMMGVQTKIMTANNGGLRPMPDGKGGTGEYYCQKCYVMYVATGDVYKLSLLGFAPKRLKILAKNVTPNPRLIRVESIIDEERLSDTFCFNEPLRHAGVFNGILTGQSETYGVLIDTLIADAGERDRLFRAIETIPAVGKKAAWATKWLNPTRRFAERLLAFLCIEGILFSGSFCAIFWLKQRGLMPGLGLSNQFISRDEGLHQDFGALLYTKLRHRLARAEVEAIVREAVDNEKEFITEAIPCKLVGMNADLMKQYIEFVADRLVTSIGYEPLYRASNPFPWMELISLSSKDNFFERFSSEYQKAGVMAHADDQKFALDEDF